VQGCTEICPEVCTRTLGLKTTGKSTAVASL